MLLECRHLTNRIFPNCFSEWVGLDKLKSSWRSILSPVNGQLCFLCLTFSVLGWSLKQVLWLFWVLLRDPNRPFALACQIQSQPMVSRQVSYLWVSFPPTLAWPSPSGNLLVGGAASCSGPLTSHPRLSSSHLQVIQMSPPRRRFLSPSSPWLLNGECVVISVSHSLMVNVFIPH